MNKWHPDDCNTIDTKKTIKTNSTKSKSAITTRTSLVYDIFSQLGEVREVQQLDSN